MSDLKVWVCQVRREAFVGGESQRCRHFVSDTFRLPECGEMELIGGEPVEWCVEHDAIDWTAPEECAAVFFEPEPHDPCQFETQIRVGP